MEIRLKNMYPDAWVFPEAEAMVCVSIMYPGSGGEILKDVKGVRKEYRFRSIVDADAMFEKIAGEMREGYKSGKYKLGARRVS